jgi:Spy/CpxP family protein refolding chaperone
VVRREEATRERLETLNPVRRGARNEGLSEEQQAKLRELNQKMRDEQRVLYDKQREARVALEKAAQAEDFKEAEIRAKAAVIGEIEAELALIRAKHYKELSQILPKEEMQRIREANAGARPGVGGQLPGGGRPGLNRPAVTPQQQQ